MGLGKALKGIGKWLRDNPEAITRVLEAVKGKGKP